jgi:tetratricopeptide (TPR) repeat protein
MIRLNDEFVPSAHGRPTEEIPALVFRLGHGTPDERQLALKRLVTLGAESALTDCLRSDDSLVVQLATEGLWECWLGEKGADARQTMDEGIELMNGGHLAAAEQIFGTLMQQFPDWAEAFNKQATLLFLAGKPAESIQLCTKVVALKPDHFGAWNGMALCAVQLEDWRTALFAAKKALSIQPTAESNQRMIELARTRMGSA